MIAQRGAFVRRMRGVDPHRVLFLDEFGVHVGDTLASAYAVRGVRALSFAPGRPGPNITLTMAMGLRGVVAPVAWQGATDGPLFEDYVRKALAPCLHRGDIVVVDRLSAHLMPGPRALIEQRGAKLVALPPYSPHLNPIEEGGAKVKHIVRTIQPKTVDDVYAAFGDGIRQVTRDNVRGWFSDRAAYLFDSRPRPGPD